MYDGGGREKVWHLRAGCFVSVGSVEAIGLNLLESEKGEDLERWVGYTCLNTQRQTL